MKTKLVWVIQCANIFIDNTLSSASGSNKFPMQAISHMENFYGTRICPESINALKVIFRGVKK